MKTLHQDIGFWKRAFPTNVHSKTVMERMIDSCFVGRACPPSLLVVQTLVGEEDENSSVNHLLMRNSKIDQKSQEPGPNSLVGTLSSVLVLSLGTPKRVVTPTS